MYVFGLLAIVSIFSFQEHLAFVIADTVSDSDVLDITAVVPSPINPGSGGGSSTGSSANPTTAAVTISGFSFPGAKLTLLRDGSIVTSLIANNDGSFVIVVNGLNYGTYQFSVYAEDRDGVVSSPYVVNVPVYTAQGYTYNGVIIPPTISTNMGQIGSGQFVTVYGYAAPGAKILIEIPGRFILGSTVADGSGFYRFEVRDALTPGIYLFRTKAQIGATQSLYSKPIEVTYYSGTTPLGTIPSQLSSCVDYSKDGRNNLVDFSILLFWFNKDNPPREINCNADNRIDIKDFSILMYFWTG